MSTDVTYMYRDASNYKTHRTVRFAGDITDAQRQKILSSLGGPDGDSFLPETVDLPTLHSQWETHYDDDHVWHELCDLAVVPGPATTVETIGELADRFAAADWNPAAAVEALEAWKSSTSHGT